MGKIYESEQVKPRRFIPSFSLDIAGTIALGVTLLIMYGGFERWQEKIDMEMMSVMKDISNLTSATDNLNNRTTALEIKTLGQRYQQMQKGVNHE